MNVGTCCERTGGRVRAVAAAALSLVVVALVAGGCGGGDGAKVDHTVSVGNDPSDVVAAYGAVWVVNDDAVGKVDPETNALALKKFIAVDEGANGIAAGGNVILVSCAIGGSVVMIDPRTNEVVGRVPVASRPNAVAYGEGAAWVAEGAADQVQRIDLARKRALEPPIRVGYGPAGLAAGYGAVWVANQFKYTVSRIDPKTNKVAATIKVGIQPTDVALGDGAVWVSNSNSNSISRIDPKTNKVVATIKSEGSNVSDIAFGLGSVWTSEIDTHSMTRIDPKDNKPSKVDVDPYSPVDVAIGFGSVWAPVADSNQLVRVKP